jgi:hypothetical protein
MSYFIAIVPYLHQGWRLLHDDEESNVIKSFDNYHQAFSFASCLPIELYPTPVTEEELSTNLWLKPLYNYLQSKCCNGFHTRF